MTSILEGPDTAEAAAEKPVEPAGTGSRPSGSGGPGGPGVHPIVGFAESLAAALDRLGAVAAWSMTPQEQRRVLVALKRQQARLAELELRVLTAADRNRVGAECGATSTPAWLAHQTKTTTRAGFADLHL